MIHTNFAFLVSLQYYRIARIQVPKYNSLIRVKRLSAQLGFFSRSFLDRKTSESFVTFHQDLLKALNEDTKGFSFLVATFGITVSSLDC